MVTLIMLATLHRHLFRRCPTSVSRFHTANVLAFASRKVLEKFKLADIGEGITECEVIKWYTSKRSGTTIIVYSHFPCF
jgi:2-oxoisovalerate dehydrogenase E2 component (dihydrolipoyl transacylase)